MSKKTPQIRFKGFTDDWEERKLGDVGDTFTGLTGKTKEDFGHGSAKFVTYVNVFQNPIATLDQLDAVEIDEKQNQVQKGDVFFTTSSETPEEVGMSSVWTYDTKNVYLNSFTFGYRPRVSFDLNYMASMLRSPSIRKKITFLAQGISRYNISKTKMLEIEIPAPNLSEQKKIGSFFKLLDDTIALHQRKLDLLKEQKKGFLQKMFPKNGAKIPELRFEGFSDDWEERKLGDFVIDYVEKTTTQNQFPVLTSSQQQGIVLQETYFANRQVTTDNNIGYYVLPRGYFTFRNRSDNDVFIFNRNDLIDKGIISYFYPVFTLKNSDSDFFLKRINNGIKRQVSIQAEGTGQHVLSMKKFKNIISMFPSLEEQEKIGSFFKQLDKTIALHQRKLDLLKEQKKGFLQKMFVS
ncbi:restriction endonuclease subunit S [Leuconostoc carnosum]|uniref:restriction endonuclease subunit S n=1 Tax=Leuconostoc carnosum TaxID=1252 RepID=UPI00123926D4|nr:restriction endonuclease subunit S [Leuconostoc carnosum]KAA8372542.1 restriction endonuclease subunit S [Leuconostoc carnosum]